MAQNLPSISSKIEQTQRKDIKNTQTVRQIKSYTSKYMQQPWGFTFANKKRDQIQKVRRLQIEREDKVLNNKMVAINERSRYRSQSEVETIYLKKSLNKSYRKQLQKAIVEQNHSHKKRLQTLKPTINLKKMEKEWQLKQSIKKNLQKYYLKQGRNRSMSIQLDKLHRITLNERNIVKFYKQRIIEGCKILVKVEQYIHLVLITGEIKFKDQLVYLIIDKDKLQRIVEGDNKNKIQILINLIKYDTPTNSLYLIPPNPASTEKNQFFISNKIDDFNLKKLRKQIRKQHIERQILSNNQVLKKKDQKHQTENSKVQKQQPKNVNKTQI